VALHIVKSSNHNKYEQNKKQMQVAVTPLNKYNVLARNFTTNETSRVPLQAYPFSTSDTNDLLINVTL